MKPLKLSAPNPVASLRTQIAVFLVMLGVLCRLTYHVAWVFATARGAAEPAAQDWVGAGALEMLTMLFVINAPYGRVFVFAATLYALISTTLNLLYYFPHTEVLFTDDPLVIVAKCVVSAALPIGVAFCSHLVATMALTNTGKTTRETELLDAINALQAEVTRWKIMVGSAETDLDLCQQWHTEIESVYQNNKAEIAQLNKQLEQLNKELEIQKNEYTLLAKEANRADSELTFLKNELTATAARAEAAEAALPFKCPGCGKAHATQQALAGHRSRGACKPSSPTDQ